MVVVQLKARAGQLLMKIGNREYVPIVLAFTSGQGYRDIVFFGNEEDLKKYRGRFGNIVEKEVLGEGTIRIFDAKRVTIDRGGFVYIST